MFVAQIVVIVDQYTGWTFGYNLRIPEELEKSNTVQCEYLLNNALLFYFDTWTSAKFSQAEAT